MNPRRTGMWMAAGVMAMALVTVGPGDLAFGAQNHGNDGIPGADSDRSPSTAKGDNVGLRTGMQGSDGGQGKKGKEGNDGGAFMGRRGTGDGTGRGAGDTPSLSPETRQQLADARRQAAEARRQAAEAQRQAARARRHAQH